MPLSDVSYSGGETADRPFSYRVITSFPGAAQETFPQFYKLLPALMDYSVALSKLCQLLINI